MAPCLRLALVLALLPLVHVVAQTSKVAPPEFRVGPPSARIRPQQAQSYNNSSDTSQQSTPAPATTASAIGLGAYFIRLDADGSNPRLDAYIAKRTSNFWLWMMLILNLMLTLIMIPMVFYMFWYQGPHHGYSRGRQLNSASRAPSVEPASSYNSYKPQASQSVQPAVSGRQNSAANPSSGAPHTKDESSSSKRSLRLPKFNQGSDGHKNFTRITLNGPKNAKTPSPSLSGHGSTSSPTSTPRDHMSDVFGPAVDSTTSHSPKVMKRS